MAEEAKKKRNLLEQALHVMNPANWGSDGATLGEALSPAGTGEAATQAQKNKAQFSDAVARRVKGTGTPDTNEQTRKSRAKRSEARKRYATKPKSGTPVASAAQRRAARPQTPTAMQARATGASKSKANHRRARRAKKG
jgi:hypothetical protein